MSAHHAALRAGSMKPAILTARRERPSRRPVVREPGRAGAQRPVELGHRLSRLPLSQGREPVHLALRPALPVDVDRLLEAIVDEGEAGLPDVARPATVAGLARRVSPLLVVLPRSRDAEAVAQALAPWVSEGRVELFPAWEVLPGEAMSPTLETMGRRMRILAELSGNEPKVPGRLPLTIGVASVRAFLQQVGEAPRESLRLAT